MKPIISLIAAMSKNRVIGYKGKMPWHLPAELAYFKKLTLGKAVLMGRLTYESIGRPLPNRRNIILTHQQDFQLSGCEIYSSLSQAISAMADQDELMIIGGATLFTQTLPIADILYLTVIDGEFEGDAFFPEWDPTEWQEISRQTFAAD